MVLRGKGGKTWGAFEQGSCSLASMQVAAAVKERMQADRTEHTKSIIFFALSDTNGSATGGMASEADTLGATLRFSRDVANDIVNSFLAVDVPSCLFLK